MIKTIATAPGQQPKNVEMNQDEVSFRQDEEVINAEIRVIKNKDAARLSALADKWPDVFALIDDILDRGPEAVKEERDAIKADNPKGE